MSRNSSKYTIILIFNMTQVRKCFLVILSVVTFNSHVSVRYGVPHPQPAFICSKSAMETPDYVWNLFKLNNRMTPVFPYTIRCFLMFSGDIERDWLNSGGFIVDFEQITQINRWLWTGKCQLGPTHHFQKLLWLFSLSPLKIFKMDHFPCWGYFSL